MLVKPQLSANYCIERHKGILSSGKAQYIAVLCFMDEMTS